MWRRGLQWHSGLSVSGSCRPLRRYSDGICVSNVPEFQMARCAPCKDPCLSCRCILLSIAYIHIYPYMDAMEIMHIYEQVLNQCESSADKWVKEPSNRDDRKLFPMFTTTSTLNGDEWAWSYAVVEKHVLWTAGCSMHLSNSLRQDATSSREQLKDLSTLRAVTTGGGCSLFRSFTWNPKKAIFLKAKDSLWIPTLCQNLPGCH